MTQVLELKAVVPDPGALRARLADAGAVPGFRGLMTDCRYDRDGALIRRDEVLRVRSYRPLAGTAHLELSWKGPARRSLEGYKQRFELTSEARPAPDEPGLILEALGYRLLHTIDRWVEVWSIGGAVLRLEWYPRMDVLVEGEGAPAQIEAAIRATGLPRDGFSADPLIEFGRRYEPRTGRTAALAVADLRGEAPGWEAA